MQREKKGIARDCGEEGSMSFRFAKKRRLPRALALFLVMAMVVTLLPASAMRVKAFSPDLYKPTITSVTLGEPFTGGDEKSYVPATVAFTTDENPETSGLCFLEATVSGTYDGGTYALAGVGMTQCLVIGTPVNNQFTWVNGNGQAQYYIPVLGSEETQVVEHSMATGLDELNGVKPGDTLTFLFETVLYGAVGEPIVTSNEFQIVFDPNELPKEYTNGEVTPSYTLTVTSVAAESQYQNLMPATYTVTYPQGTIAGHAEIDQNVKQVSGFSASATVLPTFISENQTFTVTYTRVVPDLSQAQVVYPAGKDANSPLTEEEANAIELSGLVKGTDYTQSVTTTQVGDEDYWVITNEAKEGKSIGEIVLEAPQAYSYTLTVISQAQESKYQNLMPATYTVTYPQGTIAGHAEIDQNVKQVSGFSASATVLPTFISGDETFTVTYTRVVPDLSDAQVVYPSGKDASSIYTEAEAKTIELVDLVKGTDYSQIVELKSNGSGGATWEVKNVAVEGKSIGEKVLEIWAVSYTLTVVSKAQEEEYQEKMPSTFTVSYPGGHCDKGIDRDRNYVKGFSASPSMLPETISSDQTLTIVYTKNAEQKNSVEDAIREKGKLTEDGVTEATVEVSGTTALSREIMEYIQQHPNLTVIYHVTHERNTYHVVIPGNKAIVDPNIKWYGPLWLNAHYGEGADDTEEGIYVVQRGDTLSKIAKKLDTTVQDLVTLNEIRNVNKIRVGQRLRYKKSQMGGYKFKISAGNANVGSTGNVYTVMPGDTLSRIAKKLGTTITNLKNLNGIKDVNRIRAGQKIKY